MGNILRTVFGGLDGIVYWLLVKIYDLFTQIAMVDIFGTGEGVEILNKFANRVTTILGIFVLFRLTISIFTYILDPDKLSDSKKGFGSLIRNVVIMLIILVGYPFVFRYAMKFQRVVLKENTIGKLITGHTNAGAANGFGKNLAKDTITAFIEINSDTGLGDGNETVKKYHELLEKPEATYKDYIDLALKNKKSDGKYIINYTYLISTAVAGFMAYIILLFCIDIAVRTVKLGFLKLIAPLPIVCYVDPSSQKIFNNWVKECVHTYLDLFIRLAAIFFAQFIIEALMASWGNWTIDTFDGGTTQPGSLTKVFIVLGCLMFAKQFPKFIENLTGFKLDGGFTLNPMKKASEIPLVGRPLASTIGLAGRTAGNLGKAAVSAIGGVGAGLAYGALGDKGFKEGFATGSSKMLGSSLSSLGRIGADTVGTLPFGHGEKQMKNLEQRIANRKAVEDAVSSAYEAGKFNKDPDVQELKLREQALATMKQNVPSRSYIDNHGVRQEFSDDDYNSILADYNAKIFAESESIALAKKDFMRTLEDRVVNGELSNSDVSRALEQEIAYDRANGNTRGSDSNARHEDAENWRNDLQKIKSKRAAQREAREDRKPKK